MSINQVTVSGNMTRDPEVRSTASGMAVMRFGVAVNDRRKNQQTGEWEDVPNFVDCVVFGARADSLSKYLRKGMKVSVQGKLHYSKWQDNSGNNRSKLEVYVDEIEFMTAPESRQQPPAYAPQAAPQAYAPAPQACAPAPQAYPQQACQPLQTNFQATYQANGQANGQANAQQSPSASGSASAGACQQTLYEEDIPF